MDLSGFSCRDLVGVLINHNGGETEIHLVVCSAYLPFDVKDPPLKREFEELAHYCKEGNRYLVIGRDSSSHHRVWGSTKCNDSVVVLLEFPNSSNLVFPHQGIYFNCCTVGRLEVTDITQGSFGLLESLKGWEVVLNLPCRTTHTFCSL